MNWFGRKTDDSGFTIYPKDLTAIRCVECGAVLLVVDAFYHHRVEKGSIWCPAGHEMVFKKKEEKK